MSQFLKESRSYRQLGTSENNEEDALSNLQKFKVSASQANSIPMSARARSSSRSPFRNVSQEQYDIVNDETYGSPEKLEESIHETDYLRHEKQKSKTFRQSNYNSNVSKKSQKGSQKKNKGRTKSSNCKGAVESQVKNKKKEKVQQLDTFVWGSNKYGQLGHTQNEKFNINSYIRDPVLSAMTVIKQIKMVACGRAHTLIMSGDGELFTFGDNSLGQLGIKPDEL